MKGKWSYKWGDLMNGKIVAVFLLVGFGCIGFALFGAQAFDQYPVSDNKKAIIADESETNVTKCTLIPFHLELNQIATLKLFVYINETSTTDDVLHLKFISSKKWNESQFADPSSVTGEQFKYALVSYPPTSISYSALVADFSWVQGRSYTIEFVGDNPSTTKPIPGDYYLLIYNEDASTPDGTNLYYDLTVLEDQMGSKLAYWFTIIGLVLIGLGAVTGVIYYRKR